MMIDIQPLTVTPMTGEASGALGASVQAGDILVLVSVGPDLDETPTYSAGWTQIFEDRVAGHRVATRTATGPSPSGTVTYSGTDVTITGHIAAYRDASQLSVSAAALGQVAPVGGGPAAVTVATFTVLNASEFGALGGDDEWTAGVDYSDNNEDGFTARHVAIYQQDGPRGEPYLLPSGSQQYATIASYVVVPLFDSNPAQIQGYTPPLDRTGSSGFHRAD